MTIDSATLNRRVTIERYTATDGPWGTEYVWGDLRTVWGGLTIESADEIHAAAQTYAERVVTITLRFTRDLSEIDRMRCEGVTYEIKGISHIGNRDGLAIKAAALDPGAT